MRVGDDRVHPRPPYRWSDIGQYLRTIRPEVPPGRSRSGRAFARWGGIVAAIALDPVERLVRGVDELGASPAVGREGRNADRRADRDRSALFAHEGVIAEGV